jgi:hypothetical protein
MARVVALIPDLMFGSRVQSSLATAGHEVELVADPARLRDRLGEGAAGPSGTVLVIDLTNDDLDGPALVESLAAEDGLTHIRTLGFYAHVDTTVRDRAQHAGFDLVVPRSRMAREGPELVRRLAG